MQSSEVWIQPSSSTRTVISKFQTNNPQLLLQSRNIKQLSSKDHGQPDSPGKNQLKDSLPQNDPSQILDSDSAMEKGLQLSTNKDHRDYMKETSLSTMFRSNAPGIMVNAVRISAETLYSRSKGKLYHVGAVLILRYSA